MRCSGVSHLLEVYGDHMLRPRARLVPLLLLAIVFGLSGCGSDAEETHGPSKQAVACRKEWKALEQEVGGRNSKANPSALAARWNSIAATIDYYATARSTKGCDQALGGQEKAMDALDSFATKLAPYDMELRLDQVRTDAQAYASAPAPSSSPPSGATKKGKKQPAPPRPPKPTDVANALKLLTQQAPLATQQQKPGWQQSDVTELGDAAAVSKAVSDLAFLSSESQAYRSCIAAMALINAALSAK